MTAPGERKVNHSMTADMPTSCVLKVGGGRGFVVEQYVRFLRYADPRNADMFRLAMQELDSAHTDENQPLRERVD
jgi:hypothetical protein